MIEPKSKIVTFQSEFYHNGHSMQRDRLLIEIHGEEWLKEQKAKGLYGGDWPDEIIGTPKNGQSGYINDEGRLVTHGEVVILESIDDLTKHFAKGD